MTERTWAPARDGTAYKLILDDVDVVEIKIEDGRCTADVHLKGDYELVEHIEEGYHYGRFLLRLDCIPYGLQGNAEILSMDSSMTAMIDIKSQFPFKKWIEIRITFLLVDEAILLKRDELPLVRR